MKKLWQTGNALDKAVEAYTVGDDPLLDARLLPYEVYGSLAHAAGLLKIGLLTKKEFASVQLALKKLLKKGTSFVIRREQEDIHTAVEQYLTQALGDAGKKIHTGRSRNDQVQVDLRLYMKDSLLNLHHTACAAARAWLDFGKRHQPILFPGYTHLQRAMPTTVGHWAASHVEALAENARLLEQAYEQVDASPLGSAAGYGAGLPLDRAYVARLLGFARVQRNTLRVQTSRPRMEAVVVSVLAVLARDLGVLAGDISLYTTAEFGFFKLGEAFTTGSSIMPQKRNPDVVELTRGKAALFPGWLQQILSLGALTSGYHRDYQLTKGPLLSALNTAEAMLDIIQRLPDAVEVKADRCRAALTDDLLATQRALEFVRGGMPFREAYQKVAAKARGNGALKPAKDVKLPDYAGAPGNPEWNGISGELSTREKWGVETRTGLKKAWEGLLDLTL